MTENEPRIFLCHASEDKERVRELYHRLKEAGYHPWLDKCDLLPGQNWRAEIRKILSDLNNLVVVCLSNSSITKRGTVQREIKWALDILEEMPEDAIYLIPARLERCQVPERLKALHWADLFEPDGFEYLKRSLDYELSKRQPSTEPEEVEQAPVAEPVPAPRQKPRRVAEPEVVSSTVVERRETIEPELILIPAGEFLMGSDAKKDKDADDDEQPQHKLYLPDYYIARTPVTNAQYLTFVDATDYVVPYHWQDDKPPAGKEDHPVVNVTWYDAMAYCRWLAESTGKGYRLLSEAEWEKAARGADGRIYPWGDDPPDETRCNFGDLLGGTTPVGQYSPRGDSPYGCVDMAGGVREWTLSLWGEGWTELDFKYPYDPEDGRENLKAGDGVQRVLRGGAFLSSLSEVRCAFRNRNFPDASNFGIGLRPVLAPGLRL